MTIKIYIDQGHSPESNGGSTGNNLIEQDVTFIIGSYLADLLRNDSRFEIKTSRQTIDEVIGTNPVTSLNQRVSEANAWPADYFISLHCNYSNDSSINGSEIYVYKSPSVATALANFILNAMTSIAGTKRNGIFDNPNYYVLRRTTMPALLIELAYISNYPDALKLENDPFAFAYGIYVGILRYFFREQQSFF